ncbi:MAG: ABC transporter permease [Thermogemmata sp.]|nr:ABC transporter permease [Thermogemmata sp.]
MRQFWAVMQDSYREAVDGWVISIMLVLSLVVIGLVASMSFEAVPPEEALPTIVRQFSQFYPSQGRERVIRFGNCQFTAEQIETTETGFRLLVQVHAYPSDAGNKSEPGTGETPSLPPADTFREMVATALRKETGEVRRMELGDKTIALGGPARATIEEQRAVQVKDMEQFLAQQFQDHAGLPARLRWRQTVPGDSIVYSFEAILEGGVSVRGWPHTMRMFFGTVTITRQTNLGMILYIIEDQIINGLGGAFALLIGVIITSFFIPNMLRKGSIDLIVSKPIGRMTLLTYKYIGGLIFIFLITSFTVGGIWLALALRSGYWDPRFLAVIPLLTFTFAILYALSVLVGVLTRSAVASLLLTLVFMLSLYIVGQVKNSFDTLRKQEDFTGIPPWAYNLVDTVHNILPRYKEVDKLIAKIIADGTLTPAEMNMLGLSWLQYPSWWNVIGVSFVYIVVMVGLAGLWFRNRDY